MFRLLSSSPYSTGYIQMYMWFHLLSSFNWIYAKLCYFMLYRELTLADATGLSRTSPAWARRWLCRINSLCLWKSFSPCWTSPSGYVDGYIVCVCILYWLTVYWRVSDSLLLKYIVLFLYQFNYERVFDYWFNGCRYPPIGKKPGSCWW